MLMKYMYFGTENQEKTDYTLCVNKAKYHIKRCP